jgi:hypothetical protein
MIGNDAIFLVLLVLAPCRRGKQRRAATDRPVDDQPDPFMQRRIDARHVATEAHTMNNWRSAAWRQIVGWSRQDRPTYPLGDTRGAGVAPPRFAFPRMCAPT